MRYTSKKKKRPTWNLFPKLFGTRLRTAKYVYSDHGEPVNYSQVPFYLCELFIGRKKIFLPGTWLHKSHKGENLPDGPTVRAVSCVFSSYLNSLGLAQWECEPSQLGKELHPDGPGVQLTCLKSVGLNIIPRFKRQLMTTYLQFNQCLVRDTAWWMRTVPEKHLSCNFR